MEIKRTQISPQAREQATEWFRYREICESLGWSVYAVDGLVELGRHSPAGEDFFFEVAQDDFVKEVKEYTAYFDIDEHITMWLKAKENGSKGIPSARELVKDAHEIAKMLQELSSALTAEGTD